MILIDANLLIYSVNQDAPLNRKAKGGVLDQIRTLPGEGMAVLILSCCDIL